MMMKRKNISRFQNFLSLMVSILSHLMKVNMSIWVDEKSCIFFFSVGIPPAPLRPNCDNMENLPVLRSPRMQQPKTLMVTSSSITGENFHTGFTGKFLKILKK